MKYGASEYALTKATKVLWAKKPEMMYFPMPDPDRQTKLDKIEMFQHKRLFQIIRNDGFRN